MHMDIVSADGGTMKRTGNLFEEVSQAQGQETYETLIEGGSVRIERIVSFGHASQEGFWYDQAEDEWVVLLEGAAILEDAEGTRLLLKPGDTVWLPAGLKHRVAWTPKHNRTLWLAVFSQHDSR